MTGKHDIIEDKSMKEVVNVIRALTIKHKIAFFLVHHTGWPKFDNQGRPQAMHGKGGSSLLEDVNLCLEVVRVKTDTTRITVKKVRSRRAKIAMGQEFLGEYDHETTRIVGSEMRLPTLQAKWLIDKFGLQPAAKKVGCSRQALGNYAHGLREAKGDYKARLNQVARDEGWIATLTDALP
jgi:RecA-family ATPase